MTRISRSDKQLDRRISTMMRNETPTPYADEWFVKKTVNRLPPRRRLVSLPELLASLFVFVVSVALLISETQTALSFTDLSAYDPSLFILSACMTLGATLYISIPILNRCIRG